MPSPVLTTSRITLCMLEASNLECVRGERRLFAGVSFRLAGGEMLYLQGKNGSGKTSLLRMLCGLTPAASGDIHWRGQPIGKLGDEFRSELCYLGHQNAIKEELTPLENILVVGHTGAGNARRGRGARCPRTARTAQPRRPRLPLPFTRAEAPRRARPSGT
jgi:ABC-type branched-subunit amino acid transport system ATPase component